MSNIARNNVPVKPTRVAPRHAERFGRGITRPSAPAYKAPVSLSDLEWYSLVSNVYDEDAWDSDTSMEHRAAESAAIDNLCAGLIPDDMAMMIERMRV